MGGVDLKPVVKGTKDMKLLEDNARVHIHCDVINYLTE